MEIFKQKIALVKYTNHNNYKKILHTFSTQSNSVTLTAIIAKSNESVKRSRVLV
jgi:hypothetical protein